MRFLIDTHTHTLASGHAYNTINEMAKSASDKGMSHLAITEHAPRMPGSCHELYFSNLGVLPREKYGVRLLFGSEVNILDFDGTIDLPEYILKKLDIVIASYHTPCIRGGSVEENTRGIVNVIKNPHVNVIGHPDDARYQVDYEAMVLAAKEYHTLLELNNVSLHPMGPRTGAFENDIKILELCKKHQACICLGSDAHAESEIGNFSRAHEVIEAVDFPERLIANSDFELLRSYLPAHLQKEKIEK